MSAISSRAAAAPSLAWRTLGAVALLVLALAVGAAIIAGSQRARVPAPFGPATNGLIAYSQGGDILAVDQPGGRPRTLIGGPATDTMPVFSPDGRRFVFARITSGSTTELWVARDDGSDTRRLAGAAGELRWLEWSPLGDAIATVTQADQSTITMVPLDGNAATVIRTGLAAVDAIRFRPIAGAQIAFRGRDATGTMGIYIADRDGSNLVRLALDPGFERDDYYAENSDFYFDAPAWSPDGTQLMYHTLEPDPTSPAGPGFRIHIATIDPAGGVGLDRRLQFDRQADDEFNASWLPNAQGIVFEALEGTTHRLVLGDPADNGPARDLGVVGDDWLGVAVSPDGRFVISTVPMASTPAPTLWLTDLVSMTPTKLDVKDDFNWQRLAP